jgi:hypothetical protein
MNILRQDIRSQIRGFNANFTDHDAGVLSTRLGHSVRLFREAVVFELRKVTPVNYARTAIV